MTDIDIMQAGSGPTVILVHSSVAGARQWRRLMSDLEGRFHLIAINLFGYGSTPAWSDPSSQTLEDQARLVEEVVPKNNGKFSLIGHSFGGSVAMKAATKLGSCIDNLILLEPNPFYLLEQHDRREAFAESMQLRNCIKECGSAGEWLKAAEKFADYWGGSGTWSTTPDERKATFAEALKPNFHEWDAVMDETTSLQEWVEVLPKNTVVASAQETVRPIREIVELMQKNCSAWRYEQISEGGHMAPLTRPDIVNPLVASILDGA